MGDDIRDDEGQRGRGQDPERTTRVELRERDAPVLGRLAEQQSRDQEAREDEEDVDAHVAAPEERHTGMVEHDEQDGDRTQALEVAAACPGRNRPARPADKASSRVQRSISASLLTVPGD